MRAARPTLAGFMTMVGVLAGGMAAMRLASPIADSLAFSFTLGALTFAILAAMLRRKSFWVGFALCGWIHFVAALGPWFVDAIKPDLITTHALNWLYPRVSGAGLLGSDVDGDGVIDVAWLPSTEPPPKDGNGRPAKSMYTHEREDGKILILYDNVPNFGKWPRVLSPFHFERIGLCVATILIAYLGGIAANWLAKAPPHPGEAP